LIRIFAHAHGVTKQADRVDPSWLAPGSEVKVWVDMQNPSEEEGRILKDVFHFHDLAWKTR
jgi:Mg2+ and Co2+ transporter CorA